MLRRLLAGELTEAEALAELSRLQLDELEGRARLDLGREVRRGIPEVILAAGKTTEDVVELALSLSVERGQALVSRLSGEQLDAIEAAAPGRVVRYGGSVRVVREGFAPERLDARAGIVTAGTSDLDVAHEARMVLEAVGIECSLVSDVGVAGLHRLTRPLRDLLAWEADVLVVAAGMDGVLPGVVAALVPLPVIGVPVSTGYGKGGAGEAALMTMLQSCSTGLTTVNIDNGIGAGAAAVLICARVAAARRSAQSPARQPQAAR